MYNQPSLTRREFVKGSLTAATLASAATWNTAQAQSNKRALRLGGPVQAKDPDSWIQTLNKLGYRAAYCPVGANVSDDVVKAYADAAKKADIVIAEVGAWSNPISPDEKQRKAAINKCKIQLALAERIGANCCVNITGSRNVKNWAGPHPDNLTQDTFDRIVETTRSIIDYVKPTRTCFTLETMPWAYPDSVDSYVRLLKAIDRKQCACHFDPVNLICSPQRYYNTGAIIREGFAKLGPLIKSCHAKDIILSEKLTTHLDEIRPGLGGLDYAVFLKELNQYPNVPLMLEHLQTQEEYKQAADHIRTVAQKNGLSFGYPT
jgi:sugar phosphate isomerase/epimerase